MYSVTNSLIPNLPTNIDLGIGLDFDAGAFCEGGIALATFLLPAAGRFVGGLTLIVVFLGFEPGCGPFWEFICYLIFLFKV